VKEHDVSTKDETLTKAIAYMGQTAIIVLSTITQDGRPALRSMASLANDGLEVYFSTGKQTEKVRHIQSTPNVSVLFQHEGQELMKFQNVTLTGIAEPIPTGMELEKAINLLGEKNPWFKSLAKTEGLAALSIYKVRPISVKYLDYSHGIGPDSTKEVNLQG
jgi:general stress protein 26